MELTDDGRRLLREYAGDEAERAPDSEDVLDRVTRECVEELIGEGVDVSTPSRAAAALLRAERRG